MLFISFILMKFQKNQLANWLIMLVTMATPVSSHLKDKNSIFTARDEDMIFLVKGKILVFNQYLY